jgi:hypothetical protein
MKMTNDDLRRLFERNQSLSKANEGNTSLGRALPHPQPEPAVQHVPAPKNAGKEMRPARSRVRITSKRARLLDADNLIGGGKFLLDAIRQCRLIEDDSTEHIILEMRQEKVAHRKDEETVIEIEPESVVRQ